jgi:hypothetical protein
VSIQLTYKQRQLLYSMDKLFSSLMYKDNFYYSVEQINEIRGIIQNICLNDGYETHDRELLNHLRAEYIAYSKII